MIQFNWTKMEVLEEYLFEEESRSGNKELLHIHSRLRWVA